MGAMFHAGTNFQHPFNAKTMIDPLGMGDNPTAPAPPAAPPPAPTADNSQGALNVAAQQEALSLQRGRAATILTGGGGLNTGTASAANTLLGQ